MFLFWFFFLKKLGIASNNRVRVRTTLMSFAVLASADLETPNVALINNYDDCGGGGGDVVVAANDTENSLRNRPEGELLSVLREAARTMLFIAPSLYRARKEINSRSIFAYGGTYVPDSCTPAHYTIRLWDAVSHRHRRNTNRATTFSPPRFARRRNTPPRTANSHIFPNTDKTINNRSLFLQLFMHISSKKSNDKCIYHHHHHRYYYNYYRHCELRIIINNSLVFNRNILYWG